MGSGGSKTSSTSAASPRTETTKSEDMQALKLPKIETASTGRNHQTQVPPDSERIKLPEAVSKDNNSGGTKDEGTQPRSITLPVENGANTGKGGVISGIQPSSPSVEEKSDQKLSSKPEVKQETVHVKGNKLPSDRGDNSEMLSRAVNENKNVNTNTEEELVIEDDPVDQRNFDTALDSACLLIKVESVLKRVTKNVTKLQLQRALPLHFHLPVLLKKMENLQELDLSNNSLGPQGFRAICLAMCHNSSIRSLNLAGNRTDTDTAEALGKMVSTNKTLAYLDVSSNYFGKDYFSRCVGPALKTNTMLRTLRAESIGSTDIRMLVEGLKENTGLVELDFSSNDISDKTGLGKGIGEWLKSAGCSLSSLALSQCRISDAGLEEIRCGLQENKTLTLLNLAGNDFASLSSLLGFIVTAASRSYIRTLSLEDCKVKNTDIGSDLPPCDSVSMLQVLGLSNCGLTDAFFTSLGKTCQGKLLSLIDLDVSSNEKLTPGCMTDILQLTSSEDSGSCLRRLMYGLNDSEALPEQLLKGNYSCLSYVNMRKSKISAGAVGQISQLMAKPDQNLSSLILDGLKLSNTPALKTLLENVKNSKLTTLSLGGCSLDDKDLTPLTQAVMSGWQLHMLKLCANRLSDKGVASIVDSLLKHKTHPLAVLDLSDNRLEDEGAEQLCRLFTTKSHSSRLHSLNISSNFLGKEGLLSLVSVIGGKFPMKTLYLQAQKKTGQDEKDMVEIFTKLATSLGFTIKKDKDVIKEGCSDLPTNLPEGLVVNLSSLGGQTGDIGRMLDSPRIFTDYTNDRLPKLSLAHVMEICCWLKGIDTDTCVWSEEDWNLITGANRATTDTPTWLKLPDHRDKAVYLSNLPGNTTQQKMEAIFEMEADCNLDEVCLMKDPVTRAINGTGWALMVDTESVQKAVDFFNSGEAKVFGQAFMVSRIKVKVDNDASQEAEAKAREEHEIRAKLRQKEDAEHRSLIQRSTEESWKRHAYRLAHPAYADGRIW